MTYSPFKLALSLVAAAGISFSAPSAMAADQKNPSHAAFTVKSAADSNIRTGAQEFRKGNYERSAARSRAALKSSISLRRAAIAHSNLCAAYAIMGDMKKAEEACNMALTLRPDYLPAQGNKAALTIKLAQK